MAFRAYSDENPCQGLRPFRPECPFPPKGWNEHSIIIIYFHQKKNKVIPSIALFFSFLLPLKLKIWEISSVFAVTSFHHRLTVCNRRGKALLCCVKEDIFLFAVITVSHRAASIQHRNSGKRDQVGVGAAADTEKLNFLPQFFLPLLLKFPSSAGCPH